MSNWCWRTRSMIQSKLGANGFGSEADGALVVTPNKEACAGPTQTFFRPDTRAQEMWVK
jgi:hypothetical protein